MTTDALARLQDLLRELFQFESADLAFGIYRIMNHKRTEIRRFIDESLPRMVEEALQGGAVARQTARAEGLRQTTDRIRENFGEYATDSKGELNEAYHETPLGKQYLQQRSDAGGTVDLEDLKATIFNHVYTFFNRATTTTATSSPGGRSTPSRTRVRRSTSTGPTPTSTT